jgi:triacylglycerol esterase/lipase EstA (alpha/beta hydrolase family)
MRRHTLTALTAAVTAFAGLTGAGAQPAAAAAYPVDYHFSTGFLRGFLTPTEAPPGANDRSCRTSAAHPHAVVLVHGTFANMNDNWRGASPLLANNGYCVFTFNYGGDSPGSPVQGTGPIESGARELSAFVDRVLAATGTRKVDIVGHSQGGMMPRYYINRLGGADKVDKLIGLAPSNHGTTLDGLTKLADQLGILQPANGFLVNGCAACVQQQQGSAFMNELNSGSETAPGVEYTVIATTQDTVITPYTSAFLAAAPNVTNITVQDQCARDLSDHLEIGYDPIALTDVLNALDPAAPQTVPCKLVLPITGPVI